MDDEDKFTEKEIEKGLIELVKEGKLAAIVTPSEGISYINASQIIIKCPNCDCLINKDVKWKHPTGN